MPFLYAICELPVSWSRKQTNLVTFYFQRRNKFKKMKKTIAFVETSNVSRVS